MNREKLEPYILTVEKEEKLWKESIIVFDSSALLDFYFLPKVSRTKIYTEIFEKLLGRLWLPSQVEYEYLKNRESSITNPIIEKYNPLKEKVKKFENVTKSDLLKKIEEISRESSKSDKHPYIEQHEINTFKKSIESFLSQVKSFEDKVLKQIENAEKEVFDVKESDDVLEALEKYFKVGREFSFNEIIEITEEGKHRYDFKIPPGYGDFYKKDKKGTQIFGDLIIWKQILEFSKENKLPIIFITNDIKKDEDWCYLDKNVKEDRILRPREELIKEIKDISNVDFWMYNLPQFLYNANKYLESKIRETVIQNISQFLNTKDKKGKYLKFQCENCGRIHKYHKLDFDLDFQCVGGSERNMGIENLYVAEEIIECSCGNQIDINFEVWEYPEGVHNYDTIGIDGAELWESFYFTVDFYGEPEDDKFCGCHVCDGDKGKVENYVDFHSYISLDNEYDRSSPNHKFRTVCRGNCMSCGTLHIRCPKCNSVTAISENNENIECEGGCGLTFFKETSGHSPEDGDFSLKLIDHRKVKCSSCGKMYVDHQHVGVCDKCDLKLKLE